MAGGDYSSYTYNSVVAQKSQQVSRGHIPIQQSFGITTITMNTLSPSLLFLMATTVLSHDASGFRFGADIRLESKTPLSDGEVESYISLS
jgi:hypothetical protein